MTMRKNCYICCNVCFAHVYRTRYYYYFLFLACFLPDDSLLHTRVIFLNCLYRQLFLLPFLSVQDEDGEKKSPQFTEIEERKSDEL